MLNRFSILYVAVLMVMCSSLLSCKKEETLGTPVIKYVRITRPESSDSLLVGAGQGQLIAVVGENLKLEFGVKNIENRNMKIASELLDLGTIVR